MPQETSLATAPDFDSDRTVADSTCTACGCLCDDLVVKTAGGRIIEAINACEFGRRWYLADHSHIGLPAATVEGRAVEPDEALGRAAEILEQARLPVVLGLTQTSTETVTAALALADRIGAVIDPDTSDGDRARLLATQRVGRVSATLGEVKNRADLVLFWGVDPIITHPRHWERYSVDPRGRFIPDGRAGRTIVVVGPERTATAERADQFLPVSPEAQLATLSTVRALLHGARLEPTRIERSTGLDLATLQGLTDRLKAAKYGAWFYDASLGCGPGGADRIEAMLTLVRDLNRFTRFVVLGLGGPGNPAGAEAALTWQTGSPSSVSLTRGSPRTLPGVTSAEALLAGGRADAALIIADGGLRALSEAARAHLGRIPRIVIGPRVTAPENATPATVALDAATAGIDAGGTVMRSDGVVLPLRPPLNPSPRTPTDRAWLQAIEARLHSHVS